MQLNIFTFFFFRYAATALCFTFNMHAIYMLASGFLMVHFYLSAHTCHTRSWLIEVESYACINYAARAVLKSEPSMLIGGGFCSTLKVNFTVWSACSAVDQYYPNWEGSWCECRKSRQIANQFRPSDDA